MSSQGQRNSIISDPLLKQYCDEIEKENLRHENSMQGFHERLEKQKTCFNCFRYLFFGKINKEIIRTRNEAKREVKLHNTIIHSIKDRYGMVPRDIRIVNSRKSETKFHFVGNINTKQHRNDFIQIVHQGKQNKPIEDERYERRSCGTIDPHCYNNNNHHNSEESHNHSDCDDCDD